ncbi:PqiC family protein [Duganella aceris]|uniref:Membrane integrity-associated transporter subunit PqiC n=1 Tax=Duganella aceris TaxID=2703883 RepID=A0ABX0FMX9_9BURK|nr:PqiC family protein [Duganella aceris]NGZ85889.1 membrane integrity-associated transporter subunit PqiC [Duganella aceris]
MMRPMNAAAGAVALALLAGCASAPPERFYSLSNGMGVTEAKAPRAAYYIEVPAVTVPQQVARNQLVVSTGAGRIDLLEQERWSSPPASEIGQALSLAISGELGTIDVFRTPTPDSAPVYRISTNVQRFESAPGQYALIDAVWSVRLVGSSKVLTCRSVANEQVAAGYDALVAGHRRAVARIAADISKAVLAIAAGTPPTC